MNLLRKLVRVPPQAGSMSFNQFFKNFIQYTRIKNQELQTLQYIHVHTGVYLQVRALSAWELT